jgi:uncharacterized protein YegL
MSVDGKIQALNNAIREAVPHMQTIARENPNASVLMRCVRFSTGATWHISEPTAIRDFRWVDLHAEGVTDLGAALHLVAEQMQVPPMNDRSLPPVISLVSDGLPTDDYQAGIDELLALPWGRKAVRIAIAIGEDAASLEAQDVFSSFIANPGIRPLQANNPEALVGYIRWVSTAVLKSASSPASQSADAPLPTSNVPLPPPPDPTDPMAVADVW